MSRSEHPCAHYNGLKRAHCYRCLSEDRDAEAYERHVARQAKMADPFMAILDEAMRRGKRGDA